MLIPLAFIAFWPTPVDEPIQGQLSRILKFLHRHGIPAWFNYNLVEESANVVMFIPLGFVGLLAFSNKTWWRIAAFGLLISACMELGQLLFLHERFASPSDLVTNTFGAILGAVVAAQVLKKLEVRRFSATDL